MNLFGKSREMGNNKGNGASDDGARVCYAVYRGGSEYMVCITVAPKVMKQMGWIINDRVVVDWERKNNELIIERKHEGFKLSLNSAGGVCRISFQHRKEYELPWHRRLVDLEWKISNGRLVCKFPAEVVEEVDRGKLLSDRAFFNLRK